MTLEERTKRIAEDVGMCHAVKEERNAITILCDLLYYTTLRSRWHKDAVSAIQGVCPEYFDAQSKKEEKSSHKRKRQHSCDIKTCGQCGYFMPYKEDDGMGECASIDVNKECFDGRNPFGDELGPLLQIQSTDNACAFSRSGRTRRVREFIKNHPYWYKT